MEQFLEMIKQADMLAGYTKKEDTIQYDGEIVEVYIVTVPTSESGDAVEAIFHKGTETLIDMNVKHICTCGHCHH